MLLWTQLFANTKTSEDDVSVSFSAAVQAEILPESQSVAGILQESPMSLSNQMEFSHKDGCR